MNTRQKKVTLTAVLLPAEEGGFVAMNPETSAFSQGDSREMTVSVCVIQKN